MGQRKRNFVLIGRGARGRADALHQRLMRLRRNLTQYVSDAERDQNRRDWLVAHEGRDLVDCIISPIYLALHGCTGIRDLAVRIVTHRNPLLCATPGK